MTPGNKLRCARLGRRARPGHHLVRPGRRRFRRHAVGAHARPCSGALDEAIALLADGRLSLRTHKSMPMQQAVEAHRQLESGTVHQRIILTLP